MNVNSFYRVEFGFGTGFTGAGKAITPEDLAGANTVVEQTAVERFGGFTCANTYGGWRNSAGQLVREPGKTLMVLVPAERYATVADAESAFRMFAAYIKGAFNQEAVVFNYTTVAGEFV